MLLEAPGLTRLEENNLVVSTQCNVGDNMEVVVFDFKSKGGESEKIAKEVLYPGSAGAGKVCQTRREQ